MPRNRQNSPLPSTQPSYVSFRDAAALTGLSRTALYEFDRNRKSRVVKVNQRSLIDFASLRHFLDAAPAAWPATSTDLAA